MTTDHADHASRCDGCGEVVTDMNAGLCPGLHRMAHNCGGTWRSGYLYSDGRFAPDEPERPPRHAYGHDPDPGF